jgi:hypothetical protein
MEQKYDELYRIMRRMMSVRTLERDALQCRVTLEQLITALGRGRDDCDGYDGYLFLVRKGIRKEEGRA